MDQIKRRDAGIAYIADKEVMEQQKRARKLTQELNTVDRSDFEKIEKIVKNYVERVENINIKVYTSGVDNMQIDHLREWFLNPFFHEVLIHGDLWNGCVFGDICF